LGINILKDVAIESRCSKYKISPIILSLIIINILFINPCFSETIKTQSSIQLKKVLRELKSKNISYKVNKNTVKTFVYRLMLRDSKRYRSIKIRRNNKIIYKNKLYYIQYSDSNYDITRRAKEIFIKKGFSSNHLIILKKRTKVSSYTITYKTTKELKTTPTTELQTEFRLAQSKFKIEQAYNSKYHAEYLDFFTGFEFERQSYTGKLLARTEHINEVNKDYSFAKTTFEIDEVFLKFEYGNGQFTLGKQLFSWGVFDEFSNLDRVNIKNLTRFIFDSGEAYRRPLTGIRYELYSGDFKLDTFLDFGFEPGKSIVENSLWSGIDRKSGIIRGGNTEILPPILIREVAINSNTRNEPSYGFRLTSSHSSDLSFTFLNAYPDLPSIGLSETLRSQILKNNVDKNGLREGIELNFNKELIYGIDYTKTISGQLYKIEATYIPNSLVIIADLSTLEIPKGRISIGGDLEFNTNSTTISWQILSEKIITSEDTFLEKNLTQYVLLSSSRFMADKMDLGIKLLSNANDKSFFIAPYLNYELNDYDTIKVNNYQFSGNDDSFFGFHKNNSFTSLSYERLF
jgi:hypothetical protein